MKPNAREIWFWASEIGAAVVLAAFFYLLWIAL